MNLTFCSEDKFISIIRVLENRGWRRLPYYSARCELIWMNYVKIDFHTITSNYVNHFKGAKHFSNKAYLAYHLAATNNFNIFPLTWSSALGDISQLIGILNTEAVYSICADIKKIKISSALSFNSDYSLEISTFLKNNSKKLDQIKFIHQLLLSDDQWSKSSNARTVSIFLNELDALIINLPNNVNIPSSISVYNTLIEHVNKFETEESWRKWGGTQEIWIIKPVGMSCGEQIEIVQGAHAVLAHSHKMNFKCIVQKYIERPLLVRHGRKFDIRQWILITNMNPIIIYGFSECYLRLSSQSFHMHTSLLSNKTIHLCNHAIQKKASSIIPSNTNTLISNTNIDSQVPSEPVEPVETSESSDFYSIYSLRDRITKVGKGFEWLGIDLMLTEHLEVLLIEMNMSPDISLSTPVTSRLVVPAVEDLLTLARNDNDKGHSNDSGNGSSENGNGSGSGNSKGLRWEFWHQSDLFTELDQEQFMTSKRELGVLREDYQPPKTELADIVIHAYNTSVDHHVDHVAVAVALSDDYRKDIIIGDTGGDDDLNDFSGEKIQENCINVLVDEDEI
eukprot:gene1167-2267_t